MYRRRPLLALTLAILLISLYSGSVSGQLPVLPLVAFPTIEGSLLALLAHNVKLFGTTFNFTIGSGMLVLLVVTLVLLALSLTTLILLFVAGRRPRLALESNRKLENAMALEVRASQNKIETKVNGLQESEQQLETVFATFTDITERKRTDEDCRLLASIVQSSDDAIIGKTLDGIITSWNKGAQKLYGYSAGEAVGRSIAILAPPEHSDEIPAILERLKRGDGIDHFETERITKEGKRISVSLTISPIEGESGAVRGFSTIARDITERNRVEQARRASELRYRRLFESAKDGILILDAASGQIIDVNPFLTEMLAYSRKELIGKEVWKMGVFRDMVASKSAFLRLREQGYIRYENLPVETRKGQHRRVEFVSNTYLAGESLIIQCDIRDITDRKRAEEELKETNHRLEQTLVELKAKTSDLAAMTQQLWQASKLATMGELAASIAHELNNPLATISLRIESLAGDFVPDEPKSRIFKIIADEVERMGKLIARLLQFSRHSHQQISTLDIREELENSLELVEYYLRANNIEVVREFDEPMPIQADPQQLRQVLLNLLTNASDAMPQGGKLIARVKAVNSEGGVRGVRIELTDSGPGISTANLGKIWEPFFTTKPEGKGTGLGLAISRRAIEAHHGTLSIESELGKGTTVTIFLPATNIGNPNSDWDSQAGNPLGEDHKLNKAFRA